MGKENPLCLVSTVRWRAFFCHAFSPSCFWLTTDLNTIEPADGRLKLLQLWSIRGCPLLSWLSQSFCHKKSTNLTSIPSDLKVVSSLESMPLITSSPKSLQTIPTRKAQVFPLIPMVYRIEGWYIPILGHYVVKQSVTEQSIILGIVGHTKSLFSPQVPTNLSGEW